MKGWHAEWTSFANDLEALSEVEVCQGKEKYLLRNSLQGVAGKVLQAVGVAIPPPVRPA